MNRFKNRNSDIAKVFEGQGIQKPGTGFQPVDNARIKLPGKL
jgi:hypothetical protein